MLSQTIFARCFNAAAVTLVALLMVAPVWADSADQELIKLLDEFLDGASRNDPAAHERFWSDDLVYTSSAGSRYGKAEIMGSMKGSDDESESEDEADADGDAEDGAAEEAVTVYSREALLVRVYGDAAVVTFKLVGTEQSETPTVTHYYNTGTFLHRDDEWRAIAWQATRIPADS